MLKPISIALAAMTQRVRAELMRPFQVYDPRNAEIGGEGPKWYVVQVWNRDAEADLAKHRFGICVPEIDEAKVTRGKVKNRLVPLVPGYVFVFMWETDHNWHLLVNTPGVVAILGWVEEAEIDKLRYQENCERVDRRLLKKQLLAAIHHPKVRRRKKSRRAQRRRKAA